MKVQEAAFKILGSEGRPLPSRELARLALMKGWVTSASQDPVFSIASTIEKNIRSGTYNRPELVFVPTVTGRQVGLPNWRPQGLAPVQARKMTSVQIPADLAEKVRLATHARVAPDFESALAFLLKKGLSAAAPEIREAMLRRLDELDA